MGKWGRFAESKKAVAEGRRKTNAQGGKSEMGAPRECGREEFLAGGQERGRERYWKERT